MQQRSYYLPRNEGNEIPGRWLFFDTETHSTQDDEGNELLTLRFGVALLWVRAHNNHPEQTQWYRFQRGQQFIDLLQQLAQPKQRLMVVAHNLGFDASICDLLPTLSDLGWSVKWFSDEIGQRIYTLRCEDRTLQMVDSYNWFPFSVQELGDYLDLPKLPMPASDAPPAEWDTYCRRDVEIIYHATRAWTERVQGDNLGNFALTIAGQAYNSFRHRFLSVSLLVDKDQPRTALARASYYGGRCECFHLGKLPPGEYTYLDVNSLYPSVMKGNVYPLRPTRQHNQPALAASMVADTSERCIADVTINTDAPFYPKRLRDYLAFPIGTFRTVLAGPELAMSYERGHLQAVHRATLYECASIFDDYVDHFYQQRQECRDNGDFIGAAINKLLLNSITGKFAQQSATWQRVDSDHTKPFASWDEYNGNDHEWHQYRTIGGEVYTNTGQHEGHLAIPAIAAFITSYGRAALLSLIETAGWDHVYYCDTDSILVDHVGMGNVAKCIDPIRLGALKEVWCSKDVELYGLKAKRHDTTFEVAGMKKGGTLLPDGTFHVADFWGLTHNWSAGIRGGVKVHHYVKSLSRTYAKGIVQANGTIEPLVLAE